MSINDAEATTSEQPDQQLSTGPPPLSVIGIGASAGGLTALRAFFAALPEQSGLTFVVVVHLSPEHESMLAALLQPYTAMPVTQVMARVAMQPDQVYVIPPGKHLVVTDSFLDLAELDLTRQRQMQIDAFFRSLAESHGDGGAVILSGSGSDGAVGIQAIKEKGGLLLVQAPEEAEYDSMPRSAIATGLVDIVAPAAQLATQLVAAKQTRASIQLPVDGEQLSTAAQTTLTQLLAQLRVRTGHDFSGYKPATILRRITRRMQITQLTTLTAYLQRLRQDTHEAEALFRDLLINVTEFFRDPEAWAALESTIIPQLFAGKGRDDRVRVWSVGCATGEEAYSIAILLIEYADALVAPPAIQVFASDLGKAALDFAREGCYPEAIADSIPATRLTRFFTKENSHYRARPELREAILFTQHNLLQAPPFSRLDLILCRNLLIYIQRDLQEKIFETFYYALRPEGYLFLGNAESAEGITDLFETVDKRRRLYQRRPQNKASPILPSLPLLPRPTYLPTLGAEPTRAAPPRPSEEHRLLLETVAPPSILVDRDYNVLHLSESAGRYLLPPGGAPTVAVLKLVRPELQSELRAALLRAFDENHAVATRPIPVGFNGAAHPVYLMVRPHPLADGQMRALVIFLEDETPLADMLTLDNFSQPARQQLEAELRNAQSRLQSMREEYETTVEELRAANEELQSTNEEYKSTLEELETSKEELQSVNEELQTINQELKNKIDEVTHAHNDVQNLFIATDIATLFLDRELRVKRYTPRAADLFNLMPMDRGRPIAHLRTKLLYEQLEADAQRVLARLTPVEAEVQSQDGQWFLLQMRPYRTLEDKIDGVVITFVDITTNKANEAALRNAKEYAESIVHTIPDVLLVLEPDLRVQMANDAFYEIFQVQRTATEGRLIYELGNGQWDIPALRTLLEEILPENKVFTGYEVEHTFEQIGRRTMLVNGRQLDHAQLMLLAITDITERKRAEEALRQSEEMFSALVENAPFGVYLVDAEFCLRTINAGSRKVFSGIEPLIGRDFAEILRIVWQEPFASQAITSFRHTLQSGESFISPPITEERANIAETESYDWQIHRVQMPDGSYGVVCYFYDLSEQKRLEQAVRRAAELDAFRVKLSDALRPLDDPVAIQATITRLVMDYFGADRCYYCEIEDNQAIIRRDAAREDLPTVVGVYPFSSLPLFKAVIDRGRPFVVQSADTADLLDAELKQLCLGLQIVSFVDVPVIKNAQPVGILCITQSAPREWTEFEIGLAEEIAERTWAAVERARAEERLRESEERYRLFISATSDVVYKMSADWREMQSLIGKEFIATTAAPRTGWTEGYIPETDRRLVWTTIEQAIQTKSNFELEHRVIRLDGAIGWTFSRAIPVLDAQGEIVEWIGAASDITERKRTEEALRESESRLRVIIENLPGSAVFIVDRHLRYLLAEGEALPRLGRNAGDFVGKTIFDTVPPAVVTAYEARFRQALAGAPFVDEHDVQGRTYISRGTPLRGANGEVYAVLVVSYDITDRKQAEAALQHLNATLEQQVDTRTAQVRALASELTMAEQEERRRISQILHDDLQQLLYGMQMRMMAMINDLREGQTAMLAEYAQEVYNWMGDAIQTTRRLTVDISPPVLKHEGLADTLHWLVTQMQSVNGLHVDLHAAGPIYVADEDMRVLLFQIVRELLFNVVKHAETDHATVELQETATGEVMITIQDEGRGFDVAAALAKESGSFGLFSVKERLKLFGGRMDIQSSATQGTRITLYVPIAASSTGGNR
ncbi:MAG: PAS domain S-box protein [Caldilinea sp. CFX5]|nr:PAS domain S-box protein [Caldilinea sp. CFX5]